MNKSLPLLWQLLNNAKSFDRNVALTRLVETALVSLGFFSPFQQNYYHLLLATAGRAGSFYIEQARVE